MFCSFNSEGQYQSLGKWNGQQYGSHAFLFNSLFQAEGARNYYRT